MAQTFEEREQAALTAIHRAVITANLYPGEEGQKSLRPVTEAYIATMLEKLQPIFDELGLVFVVVSHEDNNCIFRFDEKED